MLLGPMRVVYTQVCNPQNLVLNLWHSKNRKNFALFFVFSKKVPENSVFRAWLRCTLLKPTKLTTI